MNTVLQQTKLTTSSIKRNFHILTLLFHFDVELFSQHSPYCSKDKVWGLHLHPQMRRSQHWGAGKLSLHSSPQQTRFFMVLTCKSHFHKSKHPNVTSNIESLNRFKCCCMCGVPLTCSVPGLPQAPSLECAGRCQMSHAGHNQVTHAINYWPLFPGFCQQVAKMTTAEMSVVWKKQLALQELLKLQACSNTDFWRRQAWLEPMQVGPLLILTNPKSAHLHHRRQLTSGTSKKCTGAEQNDGSNRILRTQRELHQLC